MKIIKDIREFIKNKYFKFGFWAVVFTLFVIWIGSYGLLLILPIIYDFYVSHKVNWTFWKKRDLEKKTKVIEWVDALVFAVIAATIIRTFFIEAYMIPTSSMEKSLLVGDYLFVSKVSYGPKMPNTPLALPFTHHTMPGTKSTRPYLEWLKMPYRRLAGLQTIHNDDVVVFNFPAGDTVILENQAPSYYSIVRQYAENMKNNGIKLSSDEEYFNEARRTIRNSNNYTIISRPVDKQENYIKRCVGIAGDSLQVIEGVVYINGKKQKGADRVQYKYTIETQNRGLNLERLHDMGISNEDLQNCKHGSNTYILPLTLEMYNKLKRNKNIVNIQRIIGRKGEYAYYIYPHKSTFKWNEDNFGPIYIPKAGVTVKIDTANYVLYRRIIEAYERNKFEIKGDKIFINGKETSEYTFKMNYYFMMGDNRHNSADSRFWGYVPEDHVVGKALFIWMSTDKDRSLFDGGIRFNRLFKGIN